jgi:FAD/FMN-containing dehydrogenase
MTPSLQDGASYLEDASGFRGHAEAVFVPENEQQIQELMREASARKIPVTISGAGTGVTGGRVAEGGWVVSLERFRELEIRPGYAIAGAGVSLRDLQAAAARTGQFFPPDPTEMSASVGGAVSTNASGSRSFRYGPIRNHVLALAAVFADGSTRAFRRGERIDFAVAPIPRPACTKHSAGYALEPGMEWIDLLAASEGTLAIVTRAEFRLLPVPAALLTGVVFFPDDALALDAVAAWRAVPDVRMIEYMDAPSLDLLRPAYAEVPSLARAAVLIEQEIPSEDSPEAEAWVDRLEAAGALLDESWFASSASDRERFRRFRHVLPELVNDIVRRTGFQKMGSDFAVPVEKNSIMLDFYHSRLNTLFPGQYVIFGHIGDAHLHVNILPRSESEVARGRELMLEFARKAVALGGTVAAEHGVGKRKAHLLAVMYTPQQLAAMIEVKLRFDPGNLLGRGNLFPAVDGRPVIPSVPDTRES